jgi:RNA polymerase sigma-70 factor (ECF subfamily)
MKCDNKELSEKLTNHLGIIHKISLLYTNNRADREDLFQDICYQACRSYNSFREEAQFSTWLYRVAINTAITQVRKKNDLMFLQDPLHIPGTTPESGAEEEQSQLLFRAISLLNKIDRAIIMLWLDEKSYDEIAEIMGISKSNVSVKLVRIKKSLSENVKRLKK